MAKQQFNGTAGNNVLFGSIAGDILVGKAGHDVYIVNHVGDEVIEKANEGIDTVLSSVSYTLSANVEILILTGGSAINGTGNALSNGLVGNNAANVLDGGKGADVMAGLGGDDTYIVDNVNDIVIECANHGTDTVRTSVTYALTANVENLTLTGVAAINGTGNTLDNIIIGNSAANVINAGGGDDQVFGGGGNDNIDGGSGDDFINGGAGNDTIVGNTGFDTAQFSGARANYLITPISGGVTVRDLRAGSPDGTDTVRSVEALKFSDQTVLLGGGNNAPTAVNFANTTTAINENTNTTSGSKVADIVVTDDGVGTNNLALIGADAASFEIVGTELRLKAGVLNFEAKSAYSVQVTVNDPTVGGNPDATSGVFTVNVTDLNEQPNAGADFAVSGGETAHDTFVFATVTGTDPDTGGGNDAVNNFENLSYTIAPGGDPSGKFEINSATGELSLAAGQSLDFETAQSHVVTVRVSDGPGLFDDVTVTVNVFRDIDLAALTAPQGFTLFGADAFDLSGHSVSSAGDINGDGFDDLIIGAPYADGFANAKNGAGEAYVIYGQSGGFADIDLAALTSEQGFRMFGADVGDLASYSVSSAGDVNGDGFADLIVGVRDADAEGNLRLASGEAFVIYGQPGGLADIDLGTLTPAQGFRIIGAEAGDISGVSVAAGDVNGDGFDDLIVGANGAGGPGNTRGSAGESYVIFGSSAGGNVDLAFLSASQGFTIFGADPLDRAGFSVSSAGDVNGDGFDDVLIGAVTGSSSGFYAGESYVIFGKSGSFGNIDLAALAPAQGFAVFGIDVDDRAGFSVSSAGDVNGDGFDDVVIGARLADGPGNTRTNAGESYVIFGKSVGFGDIDVGSLTPTQGFTIFGREAGDELGSSVSSAGDVNGDGLDDLIVGARFADNHLRGDGGESYVIFGRASGLGDIDLATLTGTQGFRVIGADAGDASGRSVSAAGDVNGDGFDDLIVGAPGGDAAGNAKSDAGDSYVIFGGDFTDGVTFAGTAASEVLIGTAAAEIFVGGQGHDLMIGNGGADTFQGGAGNDAIEVLDTSFRHVDGGSGSDVLWLTGSGLTLDLTALANNRINGIERIDLTGTGDNTLRLNVSDVLDLPDFSNDLFVSGNIGDSVIIVGSGWTNAGSETHESVDYTHYINGIASLLVQQDLATAFV